ncbi:oxidoreductase [Actinophytocola algeriensis]|uniref:NAD(P)-dependent dehydrogenase (Short-subunit alcohol dehydrogenase family) n=1 Tax=Actinophytocola algeriensis TaxID=1768010 RepID=A0A7W7QEV3_9PSEU|nr:oxidoreductase [Actinophytocola algeriensis]MBB4912351.1 NAD(P)-dependent dehydrogenase (short-subunit alcohol dehydrogenase family) [Actinophytocola algeriensis]MBE1481076.1 NAD(P)-dependent dehydrogenase (short-subunit alcohol dehydrogenase family) [Actinophytocola algeriensis]
MAKWTLGDMPPQQDRTVIVTGANSGIGQAAAAAFAAAGARVILACRNVDKGNAAAATMADTVEVRALDLANLASVHEFATSVDEPIDVLVNNAGVMAIPHRRTVDGFEMQIGTNHLGHFALTGLLLDRIRDRVVTVSSTVHLAGKVDLTDLNWERRRYQRWLAYCQSKLANLLFTYELARRLTDAGSPLKSHAAHPGYASTNLQSHTETLLDTIMALGNRLVAQSAKMGAMPTLYASTMDLPNGSFAGPGGVTTQHGYPKLVGSSKASHDKHKAEGLWTLSEKLTDVTFTI